MSRDERDALIDMLAIDPACGTDLGGGLWKVRFGVSGRGKSGGVRVIYFFRNRTRPIYLLDVFAKNEKANLTSAEMDELRKFARLIE